MGMQAEGLPAGTDMESIPIYQQKKCRVKVLPKCNFDCMEDARYDAPTKMGPWAHMCPEHAVEYGCNVELMGTEFILGIAEPRGGKAVNGILDMNTSISEDILVIICPECKDEKRLELDAKGTYICGGCGLTINIPTIL